LGFACVPENPCLAGKGSFHASKEVMDLPLTREQKEERLQRYVEALERAGGVVFTDYRGLQVKDLEGLRRQLREVNASYEVIKNTLFRLAVERVGKKAPQDLLQGPLAAAFAQDPVAAAKVLTKFARDSKVLQIRGALLGDRFVDAAGVETLSQLPNREELLAQVVGALQAPIAGLVNVLAGPLRGLMNVLNARAEQLKEAA
jgi:large subunit ribosomal protein L10